jgi:predicted dehydrogenase
LKMAYKVAVIGAGGISHSHLRAIRHMNELQAVAIADIHSERAEQLAGEYGMNAYTDYREMIDQERPDIAVITLPHFFHKETAVWCAERKCHIMLEKPMALNVRECNEVIRAANNNRVVLMVGHTQQYIAQNIKAKEIIRQGVLGELVMINDTRHVHYYSTARPEWFFEKAKAGGGIMMNLGSHSIDKIQWLTDSRVTKVKASLTHFGQKGDIEGSGLVFLETSGGFSATISQSGYGGVKKNETEMMFTKGMIKLSTGQGLWLSQHGEYREVLIEDAEDPFILQFKDLAASIETGRVLACSGEYSKSVVAAVEAVYQSHFTVEQVEF